MQIAWENLLSDNNRLLKSCKKYINPNTYYF